MKKPFYRDLLVVLALTVLSVVWLLIPALNKYPINAVPYALILLFLPGYAMLALLKPSLYKSGVLNIVYSFILSFLITLIVALISSFNPLKSIDIPMFTVIPALTIFLTLIAAIRRRTSYRQQNLSRLKEEVGLKEEVISPLNQKDQSPDTIIVKQQKKPESQKKPPEKGLFSMDLLLVVVFTVICAIFVLVPQLNQTVFRTGLGLLLILFLPGYALIASLFPKKDDLDGVERVALSFGLSIALTPLIGLILNYTPYGIRLEPILISLSAITLVLTLIAYVRRRTIPEENRFWVDFGGFFNSIGEGFSKESKAGKILSIILIIAIILSVSATAYIIVKPKPGEKFTEFYILGPDGKASNYPTNLTAGQNGTVIIGIVNHEGAPTTYNLVTASNGTTMDTFSFTLQPNEKKEFPYSFTAGNPGLKRIDFLLFKMPDNSNAYRSLHLWLTINGNPVVAGTTSV